MTTTPAPEDAAAPSATFTFRDSDDGEGVLRQIALGLKPMILIEPVTDDNDGYSIDVDSTDLTPTQLADLLELLADALRANIPAEETPR